LEDIQRDTSSDGLRARLTTYQSSSVCPACQGRRLNPRSLHVLLAGVNYADFMAMDLARARDFVRALPGAEPAVSRSATPTTAWSSAWPSSTKWGWTT
jgi:excinuclease UvrABC ATPase subunit